MKSYEDLGCGSLSSGGKHIKSFTPGGGGNNFDSAYGGFMTITIWINDRKIFFKPIPVCP